MEDGDQFTVPLEDTVVIDNPILETQLKMLDINTEVLDAPDYVEKMRDQTLDDMVDLSVKHIVLDSDEEGNEVESITSGLPLEEAKRRNGECASNMEEEKRPTQGFIRGPARKVCGHSPQLLASGRSTLTVERCNTGQPMPVFLHAGSNYQGPLLVSDTGVSRVNEKISHEMNINYVDKDHKRWQCTEKMTRKILAGDVLNEEKSAPTNCEIMDKARDVPFASCPHESPSVTDSDSQEPGEPSQVNALSFVDHFVSVNNLTLSDKLESGRARGTKSPPTSSAKGVQTLARRSHSGSKAGKPGIFEWVEEHSSKNNFVKELDNQCDGGSLWQHLEKDEIGTNMPEIFDVGFDTQMAAEAMEALLYADPPNSNARYEVPENNIRSSPETGVPRRMKSKVCTHQGMAGSNSQFSGGQSEITKAANELYGGISCSFEKQSGRQRKSTSLSPLKNNAMCREPMTTNSFCEHPVNMKKNMNGRYSRVFSQQKKDGTPERHNLKQDSKSVEGKNHGEDLKKSSLATKRTKYLSSMSSLERPKNPASSFKRKRSSKMEFNAPETKQKKNSVEVQVQKKLGVRGKCFRLGSDASAEVINLKKTRHKKFASDSNGTTSLLELDLWNYPKGKRTHRNVAHYSNERSNLSAWLPINDEENKIHYPIQNSKTTKWMVGPVAFTQLKSQSFTERRHSLRLSKQKSDEKRSPGFCNFESAIMIEQMAPMELDKGKSSKQSCRIDARDSVSSVYSENIKLDAVADDNKASETPKSDEDCKKSSKSILPKPSLKKELTRLGYNRSLPDFLPREARRHHRATVCILFSQHLESKIINQQKNIIARLGFSVTSCCLDATHFIADRFVRTRNMLEAIALGKPVVTPLWLESCGRATYHIDEKNYILRDAKKEKEIGFSMPMSLACAKQDPLLKGRRVFITPNIKPGKELIQSFVKAVQGKEIQKIQRAAQKDEIISNDVLILSSEGDYTTCVPFLQKGAAVYDSELLLNGIVIQKLEYERHRLFTKYDESKCSKVGWKKT